MQLLYSSFAEVRLFEKMAATMSQPIRVRTGANLNVNHGPASQFHAHKSANEMKIAKIGVNSNQPSSQPIE